MLCFFIVDLILSKKFNKAILKCHCESAFADEAISLNTFLSPDLAGFRKDARTSQRDVLRLGVDSRSSAKKLWRTPCPLESPTLFSKPAMSSDYIIFINPTTEPLFKQSLLLLDFACLSFYSFQK
jgi:hypothetical protein